MREASTSLRPDGRHVAIHPADVRGRFNTARKVVFAILIGVYVALPWIPIGGHPAVFLDIEARRFFLFGATFNAQDVWMMVVLLLGVSLTLLLATALLGRVWCGWGCPQTVFLEALYRPVERLLLGPGEKRARKGKLTFDRAWRTAAAHALYVVISFVVAHVFLAYFVSLPRLWTMMHTRPGAHPEAFAVVAAVTALLYGNFAWFREQLCVVLCPYGRLQSVLIDADSLIVGYDERRGEPRGKVKQVGAGDCVDCGRCVAVCPTGIDIRKGLQMDCIACTACIDACDEIMVKLERPRGLIRYDSQNGLRGERRRLLRPRTVAYGALLAAGALIGTLAFGRRSDFEATLVRATGAPFVLEGARVRNSFTVHLVNKRGDAARFDLSADGGDGVTVILPVASVTLPSLVDRQIPVIVDVARAAFRPGMLLHVTVKVEGHDDGRVLEARILGPVTR